MYGSMQYSNYNYIFSHFLFPASGYNDNLATRYPSPFLNSNSRSQFDSSPFPLHDQQISASHQIQNNSFDNKVGLALGPLQSSTSFQTIGPSVQHSNINPFDDWSNNRDKGAASDFMSEEEIRIRSHEMLENEDMQHLLRLFSMGGHASVSGPEDGYPFPSYMPSPSPFGFEEDRNRSGKAVVGWLKIKAAMRWGFFIRKKAAERRAQLVELDDE